MTFLASEPMGQFAKRRPAAIGAGLLPALVAAGGLLLPGCSAAPPKPPAKAPANKAGVTDTPQAKPAPSSLAGSAKEKPGAEPKPPAPADVKLTVVDKAGYDRFLEQHRGKVVLVDFWATWCPSCVALLPHSAELQTRFADRGLVVVTVSMDDLEDPGDPHQQAQVRSVLAAKAANLENLLARPAQPGKPETDPFKAFAIPGGALSHLKLYDRDGSLVRTFDSKSQTIAPDEIDKSVKALLDKSGKGP